MSTECPLNNSNFSSTPITKRILFNDLDVHSCNMKFRNIPVIKTSDILKTPGVYCENVSGVKEVKNVAGMLRSNNQYSSSHSIFNSKSLTGTPIHRSKLDAGIVVNTLQRKLHPEYKFFSRFGQGSISEPVLAVAKDRGDDFAYRDMYMKSSFLSSKNFGDGKHVPPKEQGIRGCIYIKKSGKVYKSKIETKAFQIQDNNTFYHTKKGKHQKASRLGNYISRTKVIDPAAMIGTNCLKLGSEGDDFEIAIVLSGLKSISRRKTQIQDTRKRNGQRNGDKQKQNYQFSSELLKIKSRDTDCSNLTYKVKSGTNCDFSSNDSNNDSFSITSGGEKIFKGMPERALGSLSFATYKSRKNCPPSYSSLMSESSISPYGVHKKLLSEELWEKFENLFKNYASTSRHSGEVIPKKISTEWMMNVGVVDEYMTEKEADEAFKQEAGAKITMNNLEYKEFLIKLSLRMKLPFYEIYRRMCGM